LKPYDRLSSRNLKVLQLDKPESKTEKNQDEFVPISAFLNEIIVTVSEPEEIEHLSSRGYGVIEGEKLYLKFYETLFLLSKKAIKIDDKKTKRSISFQNFLKRFQLVDKDAWVKYLIYRDLRSRGYVVRDGFGLGIDFRLYQRGDYGKSTAKHLIFGIQEGKPISIQKLARTQRYVQNLKKNLVLAVINRRGEIVYYSLSELNLN
jgi:tRNA-intron endonuclease